MKKSLIKILSVIIVVLFLLPIVYTLLHSFMDAYQVKSYTASFLPKVFSLHQYLKITQKMEFFKLYINSIVISVSTIIGQLIISVGAAYFFSRTKSKIANAIFTIYVFLMILPLQITLISNVFLYNGIQRYIGITIFDTKFAVILPGVFSTMGVFFLKQFFSSMPENLYEIARIDGASNFQILTKIVLPYSKNSIFALCALNFIESWNIIEQALIFINTPSKYPVSLYLNTLYANDRDVFYAGSILFIFPVIYLVMKSKEKIKNMIVENRRIV